MVSSQKKSFIILAAVFFLISGCKRSSEGGVAHEAMPAPTPAQKALVKSQTPEGELESLCSQLRSAIKKLKWKIEPCKDIEWKIGGYSVQGRPIIYAEFGDLSSDKNVNLIFSMVHGDEVTPLYIGLELAHWLKSNIQRFPKAKVVVAPLVNPDGFFRSPRTRMNARGVDCNRNFPTEDWPKRALASWRTKFRSDPRRFPGNSPASEPETLFQMDLIKRVKPQKMLSIHSPLNFLDYDGPTPVSLNRFPKEYVQESLRLRKQLRAISGGFFPGSLGNYGGREIGIPTLTLELPTANEKMAEAYWKKFSQGIQTMIEHQLPERKEKRP